MKLKKCKPCKIYTLKIFCKKCGKETSNAHYKFISRFRKETQIANINEKSCLKEAIQILEKGGVVIYPTETSYGIGVDFTNELAKRKVYSIKAREESKKLSVIVSNTETIKKFVVINEETENLIKKFMPAPLTLVAEMKNSADTLAFRIPANNFAVKLAEGLQKPITSTSANLSGENPIYKIEEIIKTFKDKVDFIVDAGDLKENEPSTIYDVANKKVLRQGRIKLNG